MNQDEMMKIFFEVHSGLPREGPGDTPFTEQALNTPIAMAMFST